MSLQSGRNYRIVNLANGHRLGDLHNGRIYEKWKAVQYPGPYWTLQNTHTGKFLMISDVRNPAGKRVEVGHFQIGWKLAPRGGNYYMIALWTSVNRGPAVVLNAVNISQNSTVELVNGSYNQVWEFQPA
ncbi:hypothetical protein BDP27DRAFT_1455272 [Rhodocollybia butyracea]|uniref:Ricin B lectin domain-containing protein n=1 Tax=Rhodocollybia butyracea TaxID=206335 RepID=A0A9P5TW25_9AGAR|nr:hypothetical protein BDP27DRAFT_1455272 [Rhodocollybia butyracea]